ncbi:hypothetical protein GGQ74_002219 [Desulfobaculum xiamenense]|uniref:Uncharacterized protein n=1 Tax=Desulfobaculum xiamenense TaxID=995050 RepID=A0A846QI67_9BACT|nr:hypothetical protein [Desulfobaculum xiamenense]NJB68546.1 hypothetical protein [Desulfobaculum xiamenense]
MNEVHVHQAFSLALAASFAAAGLFRLERPAAARAAALIAMAANAAAVGLVILIAKRPPLFGAMEAFPYIALVGGIAAWIGDRRPGAVQTSPAAWAIGAFLLALAPLSTYTLNADYFMYASPWAQGFFFMRMTAMALLACAAAPCLGALLPDRTEDERAQLAARGRVHLVLAAAAFLCGELCGSVWCLLGWGDTWQWNFNFFMGYGMFLLIMIPCHLPPRLAASPRTRAAVSLAASVTILAVYVAQQFLEA